MSLTESKALSILKAELGAAYAASKDGRVLLGIGDDAAVVARPTGAVVWTVDACQEGTHFLFEWMQPEHVAHKSFHAALSDIPAMGAKPIAALCQLTLSPRVSASWLRRFAAEQAQQARRTKTPILGGNITMGESLSVVTTVIGSASADGVMTRSGARPGDALYFCGDLGLARAGYLLLTKGRKTSQDPAVARCLEAFRCPVAQVEAGQRLAKRATSCLDVSDGLRRDVSRLTQESGVRIVVESERLRHVLHPALMAVAGLVGQDPLELSLTGGEDYALLFTAAPDYRPRFAFRIGRVESGSGAVLEDAAGSRPLEGGFEPRLGG